MLKLPGYCHLKYVAEIFGNKEINSKAFCMFNKGSDEDKMLCKSGSNPHWSDLGENLLKAESSSKDIWYSLFSKSSLGEMVLMAPWIVCVEDEGKTEEYVELEYWLQVNMGNWLH